MSTSTSAAPDEALHVDAVPLRISGFNFSTAAARVNELDIWWARSELRTDAMTDFERRIESQAAALVAAGRTDRDTVRELLILECHSSPISRQFFEERLGSEELLGAVLAIAIDDSSGDAQMTASYWAARFPLGMLQRHVAELEVIAANEWDSVSVHARKALEAVRQSGRG